MTLLPERKFTVCFWHGVNENDLNNLRQLFPKANIVRPELASPYLVIETDLMTLTELLLAEEYQVWFKPDRETVMITKHKNFGQR